MTLLFHFSFTYQCKLIFRCTLTLVIPYMVILTVSWAHNVNILSEHLRLEKIGLEVHISCLLVYCTQAEEQQKCQLLRMRVFSRAISTCTFHVHLEFGGTLFECAADRSSYVVWKEYEKVLWERRESVVWLQRRHEKRPKQAERGVFERK